MGQAAQREKAVEESYHCSGKSEGSLSIEALQRDCMALGVPAEIRKYHFDTEQEKKNKQADVVPTMGHH